MAEVVITYRANDDIESLAEFISNDSETYAINQVQLIYEAIDTLVDFPEAGKIVPEFNVLWLRQILAGNYRIIYRLQDNKNCIVLTVVHGAR